MRRGRGQVAVEAALVVPLWIFLALGVVQLALMQQARLLTEYAAYSAARAGIVWSGNGERMRDAALFALLPAFGPTGELEALGRTHARATEDDAGFHALLAPSADAPVAFKQSGLLGRVRVEVLSPSELSTAEGDFDRGPSPEGLLSLRLRFLYELRLPFVDAAIFHAWVASSAGETSRGGFGAWSSTRPGDPAPISAERGMPIASAGELSVLRTLAGSGRFLVPLTATHSMRMQSSFHRKWLFQREAP